ncbi:hypothetical protein O9K51_08515 [Purpureocillium lavendulum]|uniref:Protein kinase domain-containing protein n=1 Tax=Purpureocillium lavendulum TaxID=1247861 RepID=A0AB34FJ79_9HYPO|nr:hypothetical protein O9K51_08515 [Purpureocillium lavendulum]
MEQDLGSRLKLLEEASQKNCDSNERLEKKQDDLANHVQEMFNEMASRVQEKINDTVHTVLEKLSGLQNFCDLAKDYTNSGFRIMEEMRSTLRNLFHLNEPNQAADESLRSVDQTLDTGAAWIRQNTTWVGEHRKHNSRQLAVIQPVANEEFTDFKFLAGLAHPNIARLRALYHKDSVVHVVYEYVELDVFDICPLSEAEIAEAMSQIISAVRKLFAMSISFAVACIRVTSSGTIKIVLDWTYESVREPSIQEASATISLFGFTRPCKAWGAVVSIGHRMPWQFSNSSAPGTYR